MSVPPQDIQPWSDALQELLGDPQVYESCSRRSREAALEVRGWNAIGRHPSSALMSELAMRSKPVIAIVDPYSSGSQLARDVKSRGHACWMVQSAEADSRDVSLFVSRGGF